MTAVTLPRYSYTRKIEIIMDTNLHEGANPQFGYKATVNGKIVIFFEKRVTGKEMLQKSELIPAECYSLYQKLKGCDFELIGPSDIIDLSNTELEHFVTKDPVVFNYIFNNEPETTDRKVLTPSDILKLGGVSPEEFYLVQLHKDGGEINYACQPLELVKMVCTGLKFISVKWVDLVDIEEYGKTCREVPFARRYKIKIDKNYHIVDNPVLRGRQIVQLEGKSPVDKYNVLKFLSNNPKPIQVGLDEKIDLAEKCLLRFVLQPKEQKDGRDCRRNFSLPGEDSDFLNKQNFCWETISNGGMWLIIYDYPIPDGYNVSVAEVTLMIPPSYPAAQIDMAYFFPPLQKKGGKNIKATTPQSIDGRVYQRWSRHRQPGEWVPGLDNVSTHLSLVDNWLLNDLTR
jgi:hypothetical protein